MNMVLLNSLTESGSSLLIFKIGTFVRFGPTRVLCNSNTGLQSLFLYPHFDVYSLTMTDSYLQSQECH